MRCAVGVVFGVLEQEIIGTYSKYRRGRYIQFCAKNLESLCDYLSLA